MDFLAGEFTMNGFRDQEIFLNATLHAGSVATLFANRDRRR